MSKIAGVLGPIFGSFGGPREDPKGSKIDAWKGAQGTKIHPERRSRGGPRGHLVPGRFMDPLGGGLGVHVGPFWQCFGMLFASRFSRRLGIPSGGGLGPNLGPKWGPESSRKGSRNEARCETAKMLILTNPPMFLLVFYLQLGPQIGPKRLQNPVGKRTQAHDEEKTPKWPNLEPTWPPK